MIPSRLVAAEWTAVEPAASVMTPLTHAAVGTVIFQQLRKRRAGTWTWIAGIPLAFASHYVLDHIPHFEGVVAYSAYKSSIALMVVMGLIGSLLALLLMRVNREAGRICLVLSLWIGVGSYSFSYLRIVTAVLGLAYVGWTCGTLGMGYLSAGMVSVLPDLIPFSFATMTRLHFAAHSRIDFPAYLFALFRGGPTIWGVSARLHDPFFLFGYALELFVEGAIFFGSMYLFFRKPVMQKSSAPAIQQSEVSPNLELARKS